MNNGSIITFYSFKGGVGRTMCLANIATLLAEHHKILIIDFDLEAPGLGNYFEVYMNSSEDEQSGLLDMLEDSVEDDKINWEHHVKKIKPDLFRNIDFISSGSSSENYSKRVQKFSWDAFFKNNGANKLDKFRDDLKENYDFVLLDSRTGYSDTSGICTYFLPDTLIVMFTANEQSIRGTLDITQKALTARQNLAYDRPQLTVFPIPSRFDKTEEHELMSEWKERFLISFSDYFNHWVPKGKRIDHLLEDVSNPYLSYYSFGEKLAVTSEKELINKAGPGYYFKNVSEVLTGEYFNESLPSAELGFEESIHTLINPLNKRQIAIIKEVMRNGFATSKWATTSLSIAKDTFNRDIRPLLEGEILKFLEFP